MVTVPVDYQESNPRGSINKTAIKIVTPMDPSVTIPVKYQYSNPRGYIVQHIDRYNSPGGLIDNHPS